MTDATNIAQVIAPHFLGARVDAVTPLTGGVSADVMRIDLRAADGAPQSIVLRVHGTTHSGHDAAFEYELLQALYRAGVPVPKPLFVDASGHHVPHPCLAMAFVEGTTEIAPAQMDHSIDAMAAMLFSIHQTPTAPLPDLPKRIDPIPELFDFLPTDQDWRSLRHHLAGLKRTAYGGTPVLLHGDFWPENLIWQAGHIKAVLDWEDAALGDPLSDVACTGLELRYVFGKTGADRFQHVYSRQVDVDPKRLALWQIYVAAAAQKYMGEWRLDPAREAHMRSVALQTIREAGTVLMS